MSKKARKRGREVRRKRSRDRQQTDSWGWVRGMTGFQRKKELYKGMTNRGQEAMVPARWEGTVP